MSDAKRPDRNLAMELVRVTEAAALAAGRWVGRGDKNGGDGAAVDAMRELISTVDMDGTVVIGEGEKDEAPMLYNGEKVGTGDGPAVDVAVDPIDGTRLMAEGRPNSIAVIAVAERGAMFDPSAVFYMRKIAVGPDAVGRIDLSKSTEWNIRSVAEAKNIDVGDMTVCACSTGLDMRSSSPRSVPPAPRSVSSWTATSRAAWPRPPTTARWTCSWVSAVRRRASSPRAP